VVETERTRRHHRRRGQQGCKHLTSDGITYAWRGEFSNAEINALHAEAFQTRLYDESEWNWVDQCHRHSLGWVVARQNGRFVGFANVLWDGLVHAYLEDVMVDPELRGRGVGVGLVRSVRDGARSAGCDFLHVGFEEELRSFYIDACGFSPVLGGLMELA
jgi:GNAT superfamily N-acetyltransferase